MQFEPCAIGLPGLGMRRAVGRRSLRIEFGTGVLDMHARPALDHLGIAGQRPGIAAALMRTVGLRRAGHPATQHPRPVDAGQGKIAFDDNPVDPVIRTVGSQQVPETLHRVSGDAESAHAQIVARAPLRHGPVAVEIGVDQAGICKFLRTEPGQQPARPKCCDAVRFAGLVVLHTGVAARSGATCTDRRPGGKRRRRRVRGTGLGIGLGGRLYLGRRRGEAGRQTQIQRPGTGDRGDTCPGGRRGRGAGAAARTGNEQCKHCQDQDRMLLHWGLANPDRRKTRGSPGRYW